MLCDIAFGMPKNLLALTSGAQTANGVTAQVAADGLISLSGTAAADTALSFPANTGALTGGTAYTASLTEKTGYATNTVTAALLDASGAAAASVTAAASATFTAGSGQGISSVTLTIPSGTIFSSYVIGLQLEAGGTATSWVSPGTQGVIFYPPTGETGTLTNPGNADAYPVITITGPCSDPSVANETTGETIACDIALGRGDTLVIDCRPETRGVYLNGTLQFGLKLDLGWIHCPPGDSILSFSRTGYDTKRHCTISLQGAYL